MGAGRDDIYHVDSQFLRNALDVLSDPEGFEAAARSDVPATRAGNVTKLIDTLDFFNLLVLGERIVFDGRVGGGRSGRIFDRIDGIARRLGDAAVADEFRACFATVAPANEHVSRALTLEAARSATAFFPRLARCATNLLDLFHLPRSTPTDPGTYLWTHVERLKPPPRGDIEGLIEKREITGRRFYAAILEDETAFRALCDARGRVPMSDDVLAILFMNFRLRLAEQHSLATDKVLDDAGTKRPEKRTLAYLPSLGRRDFSREFTQFVRWGADDQTKNGHAFDLGLREYLLEEWEGVGCQMQLSERRSIPVVVAWVLSSPALTKSRSVEALITECLRWRREQRGRIAEIREATQAFESLESEERKEKAAEYAADLLRSASTNAARTRAVADNLVGGRNWFGVGVRLALSPVDTMQELLADSTERVKDHFRKVGSEEFAVATKLSEAGRPVLEGLGPDLRQRLIDVFGGTVIDARNPVYDPDRFAAKA